MRRGRCAAPASFFFLLDAAPRRVHSRAMPLKAQKVAQRVMLEPLQTPHAHPHAKNAKTRRAVHYCTADAPPPKHKRRHSIAPLPVRYSTQPSNAQAAFFRYFTGSMSKFVRFCAALTAALVFLTVQAGARPEIPATYAQAGSQAADTLLNVYYAGDGLWRDCSTAECTRANGDWGDDSATYTLYLRWRTSRDAQAAQIMSELLATGRQYPDPCSTAPCPAWSDTPAWDAVTFMREYEVLDGDPRALNLAQAALRYAGNSQAFAGGACPGIPFQQPQPSAHRVKTLETDANLIKAALLIYRATGDAAYLRRAQTRYDADRTYYFDSRADLYTVHVIDDGTACEPVPRRFFASVNGIMIWNGMELWRDTDVRAYYEQAIATARAVDADLADARGVFADVQGENDVVEPLVEAMDDLATEEGLEFAREWILRNAGAALAGRAPDGTFARFFDGPGQDGASVWESNGGLALQIAAAGLAPDSAPQNTAAWRDARAAQTVRTLPAEIRFSGSGIALVGTIDQACEREHLRVFVDGVPTYDRTGLWQNPSMPQGDSVFFAWRWPQSGEHTIRIEPGDPSQAGKPIADLRALVAQ